ncbi:MAG: GNAT family N-acetyltransferase [Actinobacteria bacterium]|nr:GNAT family N-acetyltransferase [Actinomycetota bacterium]
MESARPATTADLDAVVGLARSAQAEQRLHKGGDVWARREARPEPLDAAFTAVIADPAQHLVVGTIDAVPVAYGSAHAERLRDGGLLAIVDDLYTDPGARAVGVGEAVMDELLRWARRQGCEGIDALALPGARETKNFFERFGLTARAIVVHRRLTPDEEDQP